MSKDRLDPAFLRQQIVGVDSTFETPFGEPRVKDRHGQHAYQYDHHPAKRRDRHRNHNIRAAAGRRQHRDQRAGRGRAVAGLRRHQTLDLRAQIRVLLEAATRAPSAENRQPWEFVVVADPKRRAAIWALAARAWSSGGREAAATTLPPAESFAGNRSRTKSPLERRSAKVRLIRCDLNGHLNRKRGNSADRAEEFFRMLDDIV